MKYFLIVSSLLLALFMQVSFFQMPFLLIVLLVLGIVFKEYWIFIVAFFMGILVDIFSFRVIGTSSLFFSLMLGFVFLYERKFEIQSYFFVGFATFFSLLFYFLFFQASFFFLQLLAGIVISIGLFSLLLLLAPFEKTYFLEK